MLAVTIQHSLFFFPVQPTFPSSIPNKDKQMYYSVYHIDYTRKMCCAPPTSPTTVIQMLSDRPLVPPLSYPPLHFHSCQNKAWKSAKERHATLVNSRLPHRGRAMEGTREDEGGEKKEKKRNRPAHFLSNDLNVTFRWVGLHVCSI